MYFPIYNQSSIQSLKFVLYRANPSSHYLVKCWSSSISIVMLTILLIIPLAYDRVCGLMMIWPWECSAAFPPLSVTKTTSYDRSNEVFCSLIIYPKALVQSNVAYDCFTISLCIYGVCVWVWRSASVSVVWTPFFNRDPLTSSFYLLEHSSTSPATSGPHVTLLSRFHRGFVW